MVELRIPPDLLKDMGRPADAELYQASMGGSVATLPSLMCIAVVAGESEVSAVASSAMLASDDVLNVIGKERLRILLHSQLRRQGHRRLGNRPQLMRGYSGRSGALFQRRSLEMRDQSSRHHSSEDADQRHLHSTKPQLRYSRPES